MPEAAALSGWLIAVPESRELDLFATMLEERGAQCTRCPLIAIYDNPDHTHIEQWLRDMITGQFTDLIMLTGEGIRRLTAFCRRLDVEPQWVESLAKVRKIARGPKPGRALKELKLKSDVVAVKPTTDGVIATLADEDLELKHFAVQLYGEEQNQKLQQFLRRKGARVSTVSPYIYAPDAESEQVESLVKAVLNGDIDVMIFTSTPQITRLLSVASTIDKKDALIERLNHVVVAAIGPIVVEKLEQIGITPKVTPDSNYFMKPLVRKLSAYAAANPKRS